MWDNVDVQNLDSAAFIHPSALVYGAVELGPGSSIWPNVVIRCEKSHVKIGAMTNIQDFVMLHTDDTPTIIGDYCSITHHVTIHAATVEDECLIGIGATIMDGAVIGRGSIVAGGAFVPEGKIYPPNSIIMGAPAKVRTERDSRRPNRLNAWHYHRNAEHYARGEHRAWTGPDYDAWLEAKRSAVETDADLADPTAG